MQTLRREVTLSSARTSRFLQHGESAIASTGLLLAVIVLGLSGASAWWSAQIQSDIFSNARRAEAEVAGRLLANIVEAHLADAELSAVRLSINETARELGFTHCQVVLPGDTIIAGIGDAGMGVNELPAPWPTGPISAAPAPPEGGAAQSIALKIDGRGPARLDVVTGPSINDAAGLALDAQAGIALMGSVAMLCLLLVYRKLRSRMEGLAHIREALLALDAGETDSTALMIADSQGPAACAWNELINERDNFQQVLVTKRLLEVPTARGERSRDLTSMCDAIPQGLLLVDHALHTTYANGAAGLFLGRPHESILGTSIESVLPEEARDAVRSVASGSTRRAMSVEIEPETTGQGSVLRYSVRPVRRDDESAAMIIIEDITHQRLTEESRETFVAQVTHELRTPLSNIMLYVETAMDAKDEEQHLKAKCLNVISQETRRLDRIVNDMLSVAELESGSHTTHIDDLALVSLFEDLQRDYEASAKDKQIDLVFDLPPKLPTIQADRDKITLAIHNLLGNAIKYTPEEGHITVRVDVDEETLTVDVEDDGIGMGEEDMAKVFDKFYRANDERIAGITGSGLGLALARDVIRLHGGDITVESALDKGSTFTLKVPLDRAA